MKSLLLKDSTHKKRISCFEFQQNRNNFRISSTYAGEDFLDQFLVLYIIEVQKIPTLLPVNFVRVNQLLQPHMELSDK